MKWFSLIYQGDVHQATDKKIIPQDDYSKLVSALEIVEKAEEDADKLLDTTKEKCKELKEKAKEEGFQEGLETFNSHILHMDNELKAIRHKLQQMILPIALKATKKVIAKELETFPETIVDIVLQAIAPIAESHRVTIYVNKEDKAHLDKNKPKLQEILPQAEILTIVERPDVEKGGCIIQTESGMINATLENQLKALERAFEKYTKR